MRTNNFDMALSNKKIKYIKNTAGQKSIKELSVELKVSELEIAEVLNSLSQQNNKSVATTFSSRPNNGINKKLDHHILIIIQGILVFIAPLISMNSAWYDFANLAQGLYIQSISGFMVFFWLLDCYLSKKFEIKKCKLYLPIVGIIFWSSLSFLWATNLSESLTILSLWVACATIFFVLYNMIQSSFDLTLIIVAIFSSMVYLIIIGLIQFFDPTFNWYIQVISPSGTFGNKNMLCDYIIIVLPLCFYFFMSGADKTRIIIRIISGVIFCSGILLIIFSMTRAGMLTFPILLVLFLLFLVLLKIKNSSFNEIFSKQKAIIFFILFSTTTLLLILFVKSEKQGYKASDFGNRINSIFNLPISDKEAFTNEIKDQNLQPVSDSTSIRLITWLNTLKMIQDKPLHGYGLYNWQIHYGEYRRAYINDPTYMPGLMLRELHNDYLQIIADLGFIGFFLFAWLIFSVFLLFKKIFFSKEIEYEDKIKALGLILCIVAFGMICNFSFLIVKSVPTLLTFAYFALIANIFYYSKMMKESPNSVYQIKAKLVGWLLIPTLVLSILNTSIQINRGVTDKLFKTTMDSFKQNKYEDVIKTCKEILERNPLHLKTHFVIAKAYMSVNNFEQAIYHVEYGLKYYPNDLVALEQAGTYYLTGLKGILEKPNPDPKLIALYEDKTLFWYGKAFKIREDFEIAWNNLGFMYERRAYRMRIQGKQKEAEEAIKKAEECFDKAIYQDPHYTDALLNKANILQSTARREEIILIAKKVIQICTEKLNKKDELYQKLIAENIQKNSSKFNEAVAQRNAASYEYASAVPKAVKMLKLEYSKNNNYKDIVELFEFDKKSLAIQIELKRNAFETISKELAYARNNSNNLRFGITIPQLEKVYNDQKISIDQAEINYNKNTANLLKEFSDLQRQLGDIVGGLSTLNQILEMSAKFNYLEEQETIARLQINAIYLGVNDKDIASKFSLIQENFDKATFQGKKEIIESKKKLLTDFENAKNKQKKE